MSHCGIVVTILMVLSLLLSPIGPLATRRIRIFHLNFECSAVEFRNGLGQYVERTNKMEWSGVTISISSFSSSSRLDRNERKCEKYVTNLILIFMQNLSFKWKNDYLMLFIIWYYLFY